jgi:hypothetical protein
MNYYEIILQEAGITCFFFNVKEIMHVLKEWKAELSSIPKHFTNISLTWGVQKGIPSAALRRVLRIQSIRRREP